MAKQKEFPIEKPLLNKLGKDLLDIQYQSNKLKKEYNDKCKELIKEMRRVKMVKFKVDSNTMIKAEFKEAKEVIKIFHIFK